MSRLNPFNFGTPVPPEKHIGRQPQVKAVVNDLINPGGHSYAIIGGRRFGKSSFLEATQYLLAKQLTQASEDPRYVFPILVNLKRLPAISDETGVFGFILNRLHRIFTSHRDQKKLDIEYLLNLDGTALQSFVKDKRNECTLDEFSDIVEEVITLFEGLYGFLRLVLLIDEIETVMDQDWSDALFNHLRSLIYEGPLKKEIRCVIAGASKVIDFREDGSPFLNMLNIEFLEALTEEESRSIIAWAGDVPECITTVVLQECGGHPFLIQYLMFHLFQVGLSLATTELVATLVRRFTTDRHADLERWLQEVDDEGQNTYKVLARSEDWLRTEQVRALVGRDVDQALKKLRYHGLIIHDGSWSRYRWTGELFKDWFGVRYSDDESDVPVERVVPKLVPTILRLHISQYNTGKIKVRRLQTLGKGEPKAEVDLPFSPTDLVAILKALDLGTLELPEQFKTEYIETLDTLGLLNDRRLKVGFRELIGHELFKILVAQEILPEYVLVKRSSGSIALQLCFDPEEVELAQFPWELIHDGNIHLVASKDGLEFTRYITFADPPTPLEVDLPLNLLFVSPRPVGESWLPDNDERQAVLAGLDPLCQSGHITLQELQPPTWEALEASLNTEAFEIIHFDGHGSFARVCPRCGTPHYPNIQTCLSCKADMSDAPSEGYLHFEKDKEHQVDLVRTGDMRLILANSKTRLVVLTACGSGTVEGLSVFNGLAPGLVQAGVPAVVGMQGSPPVGTTTKFVKRLYESIAKGLSIPEAVNRGRRAIYRDEPVSWFMPVVYLRSSDDTYGQLFTI